MTIKSGSSKIAGSGAFFGSMLIIFILLASQANAGSHTITSLPYTASQQGSNYSETLYVAGTNLSSATNGISFTGHNIVLNLGNDTLSFGTGNGNGNYGLRFFGTGYNHASNIKVIGGTILHSSSSGSASGNMGIRLSGGSNLYFENTKVIVKGVNGHCVERPSSGYGAWNVEFNGGRWTSEVTGYNSRCQYDGAAARLYSSLTSLSGDDYHFKIHGVNLTKSPGQGIIIQGMTHVYDCTLTVDARNDFYTYPSGGVCNSSANAFAIIAQILDAGSTIHDNVIRAGDEYLGCDGGVLLQISRGTAANPVEIYNNDIVIHRGHDQYYWDLNSKAFKSRYANKHVNIHDNIFKVQVGNTANPAYGVNGTAVDVVSAWDSGCDWAAGRYPDSFLVYENNYIEVEALDGTFEGARGARFAITDDNGYTWEGGGNIWRNNHIKTVEHGHQIGGYDNWGECNKMIIEDDIIEYASNSYGREQYAFRIGFDLNSIGNIARDISFLGGASETDIHFAGGSGERTIALQRTLNVLVLGNNDCPVIGADVTVTNNYGRTVLTGTTSAIGQVLGEVTYHYEAEDGPDSTNFNDFTVTVNRSGETKQTIITVNSASASATLRLDTVAGNCDTDIIPPGTIQDLNAIPGENHGEIILSWTAPGDDNDIGIADHYEIRYAEDSITEYNWSWADPAPDPPTPASPGQTQEFTIDGLTEGEAYYVAIKTYDEFDNVSDLSNSPESYAAGIAIPIPLVTEIDSMASSVVVASDVVDSYTPLYYKFVLDSLDNFPDPIIGLDLLADTVASTTFSDLSHDVSYFWRVCAMAMDNSDSSAWSPAIHFNLITGVAQTLASSDCAYPLNGDVVYSSQPYLEVNNLPDIDQYYFQVADNAEFSFVTESGPVWKSSGVTTGWQVPDPLEASQTYYWRVSSNGVLWTSALSFSAMLNIHPYPNPFRASEGHTMVTFTNLLENSEITISTLSGEIIKREDNIGPDDWAWDVKNSGGNNLAPGVYLYNISFPSGSTSGKVLVIR
ncbi:MAG: T9SS type A sorting domain-containing protein [candidate division Zixibacteria bacterium]|nr:T9SS type A sorting domain-containing protein [candidate division Zixibacteria bacterium]